MNRGPESGRPCWITSALDVYEDRLIRYVFGIVGSAETAGDIIQETFLKLVAKSPRETLSGSHLAGWLFRVSRNLAIDHLRKEQRMKTADNHAIDDMMQAASSFQHREETAVEKSAADSESNSQMRDQIQSLTVKQQEIIRLRFECQLSYQEIATATGNSVSNVGFILHSAIKKLRNQLTPQFD